MSDMKQVTTLDVDRIEALLNGLKTALAATPEHMALEERVRLALGGLPDWFVREIGDTARLLVTMTEVRLGGEG